MPKTTYKYSALLICVWLLSVIAAYGQSTPATHTIHLKNGILSPVANTATWINNTDNTQRPTQVLLHYTHRPNQKTLDSLATAGIHIVDYVPENTYIAVIKNWSAKAKQSLAQSYSITTILPEWKTDISVGQNNATGTVKIVVSVYGIADKQEFEELLTGMGGKLLPGDMEAYGYYNVDIAASKLRNLAGWYAVRSISMRKDPVLLDRQSIPAVKGNGAILPYRLGGNNLNGDSVVIGVGDNTAGIFHTDMVDRITNYNPAPMTNHGIHINGIAGGAAILDPLAISMTPKVKLLNFFFSSVLSATGSMLNEHNMTITNNSYTIVEDNCAYFGSYNIYSRFLDTMAIQYPTVQHVFAAGNDGELTCPPHAPGYATVGGGYQPSKNIIVVGSTTHNLVQAFDQSRGPVKDGRIKPDIVAVGASVYSGLRNNTYGWAGGTSMASPQVASGLAILTQRFKQLHNGTQPRADLLKTILLNAATDLGVTGPDFSFGFGMMDVGRSLEIMNNNWYSVGSLNNNDSLSYTISIPAGTAQAKVMLCWNDVPASIVAARQLVNDIDIVVTTPSGERRYPLVPDATPANAQKPATEQPDHLNNVEQITISNPIAGTYTITVKGYNIPLGPQPFVVAYDIVPAGVRLTFPQGGEQANNTDSFRVFWHSVTDENTFKVAFSTNNGDSWTTIADAVPAHKRYHSWVPEGVSSGNCLVRVSKNNTSQVATSQRFIINPQPKAALAAAQCPGYMNIHWSPVPNATQYEVLKKIGAEMKVTDTVTDTTYVFRGLSLTQQTYVAVQPIINGLSGYRSVAVSAIAHSGDCQLPASIGDLMIDKVSGAESGRKHTSSQIAAGTPIKVSIRNLYNADCGSYTLSWQVNSGSWQHLANPGFTIRANTITDIELPGLDFSAVGTYTLKIAIHNTTLPDPQSLNDTITSTINCLPNDPINLSTAFEDGFEDMPVFYTSHDSMGISANGHWDYYNDDDSGRIRSYIYDKTTISGNRSISMDQFMPMKKGSNNIFTGTFNLSLLDTATHEVRVDFDYLLHSTPVPDKGNMVYARANDTSDWKPIYKYDISNYPGIVKQVKSLSLTDAIRSNQHNFSSSTQIAFAQNDSTIIAARNFGTGITIDNYRMYTVANDAMMASVVSPLPNNCGLPATVPLTVKVKNGVNYTIRDISVYYSLDNGTVYMGSIDSLSAKDSVNFTFAQLLNVSVGGKHTVKTWLSVAGDTYQDNDSIASYHFLNSKIITDFPYLEQFESDNGGYYADGFMNSWQYGSPSSSTINRAASGSKAWKTNLSGFHNDLEQSYLYTPCFDLAGLNLPMLSFSMAQDIENCGSTLCDGAYLEYTYDGNEWIKLDANEHTTNWYDTTHHLWNKSGFSRWHVVTAPLPTPPSGKVMQLRFVFFSDPAVAYEGIAIDDIHIYERDKTIFTPSSITQITNNLSANQWNTFIANNQYSAAVFPYQNVNDFTVSLYRNDTINNYGHTQYTMPRSYTILSSLPATDSILARLHITEAEMNAIDNDATCPSCTRVADAYSLGITQYYSNEDKESINGSLNDNNGGTTIYHSASKVKWVPYMNGYTATVKVNAMGELWFNNGGPTGAFAANTDYLNFVAYKKDKYAAVFWHSLIDTAVEKYTLETSTDDDIYTELTTTQARNDNPGEYQYTTTDELTNTVYFRLKWTMKNSNAVHYSPVRKVDRNDEVEGLVSFEAKMASSNHVLTSWTSYIDGMTKQYLLERAANNGNYTEVATIPAKKQYGQQYFITDAPANIAAGTVLSYRLTATLTDDSKITLPIQKVKWIDGTTVLQVYPNPTIDGKLTLHWYANPGTDMQLALYDITGRIIEQFTITATEWNNTTTINTLPKAKGIYFLKATSGKYTNTFKVVYQ